MEALTPVLQNLGRKHVPRGVLDVHFPVSAHDPKFARAGFGELGGSLDWWLDLV